MIDLGVLTAALGPDRRLMAVIPMTIAFDDDVSGRSSLAAAGVATFSEGLTR